MLGMALCRLEVVRAQEHTFMPVNRSDRHNKLRLRPRQKSPPRDMFPVVFPYAYQNIEALTAYTTFFGPGKIRQRSRQVAKLFCLRLMSGRRGFA